VELREDLEMVPVDVVESGSDQSPRAEMESRSSKCKTCHLDRLGGGDPVGSKRQSGVFLSVFYPLFISSKMHKQYLNLSSRFRTVIVLMKYDPLVTEDMGQVFYVHRWS
jgi:hypothetical protein